MSNQNNSEEKDSEKTKINIHEARLRKLIQFLKNKEALVKIDYDEFGNPNSTHYSSSNKTDHSLKKLILNIWTDTTDWAYYEYLKEDYEASRKVTAKGKHHHSHEKFIRGIRCTFRENANLDSPKYKEQLFFSGDRRQATNLMAAFPNFRQDIIKEVELFADLLKDQDNGFPYQQLRNITASKCHRYKDLEKGIFQNLKDASNSELGRIRTNLAKVMSSFVTYLEELEEQGVGHDEPGEGLILDNRLKFKELSDPQNIEISKVEEKEIQEIGFQKAFSDEVKWFDDLRLKKITYWKDNLKDLAVTDWPEYFLEHVLLAYFELNTVCSQIVTLRNSLFDKVGFYLKYSKDGQEVFTINTLLSHQELSTVLSNYEYVSNSFVDTLRSDGNLLKVPLQRLPQDFDKISSPDRLFHSRIKKLLWEYLLFRMCDSSQLNKDHIAEYYTPLYSS